MLFGIDKWPPGDEWEEEKAMIEKDGYIKWVGLSLQY